MQMVLKVVCLLVFVISPFALGNEQGKKRPEIEWKDTNYYVQEAWKGYEINNFDKTILRCANTRQGLKEDAWYVVLYSDNGKFVPSSPNIEKGSHVWYYSPTSHPAILKRYEKAYLEFKSRKLSEETMQFCAMLCDTAEHLDEREERLRWTLYKMLPNNHYFDIKQSREGYTVGLAMDEFRNKSVPYGYEVSTKYTYIWDGKLRRWRIDRRTLDTNVADGLMKCNIIDEERYWVERNRIIKWYKIKLDMINAMRNLLLNQRRI